jgi:hypothetical protein
MNKKSRFHRFSFFSAYRSSSVVRRLSSVFKRTPLLADVLVDLLWELVEEARHRHGCPRRKSTIGFPRMLAHAPEYRNKLFLSLSCLDAQEQVPNKWKRFSAGSAPAT